MNKTELIEVLAEKTGATKLLTEKVINAYLKTVMDTVAKGENVSVVGFGAFSKAHRNARLIYICYCPFTLSLKVLPGTNFGRSVADS